LNGRLFFKEAVGAKRRHQVDNEAMQRAVARMFYLANIFQLIVQGCTEKAKKSAPCGAWERIFGGVAS
jgi:hypothetical protein